MKKNIKEIIYIYVYIYIYIYIYIYMYNPVVLLYSNGASQVAQLVKNLPAIWET